MRRAPNMRARRVLASTLAATISEYMTIAVFTIAEPASKAVMMPSMEILSVAILKTSNTCALARIASGSQWNMRSLDTPGSHALRWALAQ